MNDMRIIAAMIASAVFGISFLVVKAFSLSMAWVFIPGGVLAILFSLFCLVMSGWSA